MGSRGLCAAAKLPVNPLRPIEPMSQVEETIKALRGELEEHNYRYYVLDAPVISDYEFDMKMKELQQLEHLHPEFFDPNSPTQRVGGEVTKKFETVAQARAGRITA